MKDGAAFVVEYYRNRRTTNFKGKGKKYLVLRVNNAMIIVLKEMSVLDFVFLYQLMVHAGELIRTYQ